MRDPDEPIAVEMPKLKHWQVALGVALGLLAGAFTVFPVRFPGDKALKVTPSLQEQQSAVPSYFKQPDSLAELLQVPLADLGRVDIARMDLLCSEGLPGCERTNLAQSLAMLDTWTEQVRQATVQHRAEFLRDPMRSHTEAQYDMMMIISVLAKGCGVHYDHDSAVAEYGLDPAQSESVTGLPSNDLGRDFFAKSDLFFLDGLLGPKRAGTCSSLPVLVTAIAQRLGYPVHMVNTFRHSFVRWDDGKERFNVETTVVSGLQIVSDYDYRQWPRPVNDQMMAAEGYLQPLNPQQMLACFLYTRVGALLANGRLDEAKKLLPLCGVLVPTSVKYTKLPSM